jgi:ketosteroid isomerase-like protein
MNRRVLFALASPCLLLVLPGAAPAQDAQAEIIKKLEMDRAAAVVKGDVAKLEKETSDDFTFINFNGQLSGKAETMNAIRSGAIKLTSNQVSDLKVRVYGDTAVVTGRSDAQGTIGGGPTRGPVMFTRVYVKKDGRWQAVAFQQTPIGQP